MLITSLCIFVLSFWRVTLFPVTEKEIKWVSGKWSNCSRMHFVSLLNCIHGMWVRNSKKLCFVVLTKFRLEWCNTNFHNKYIRFGTNIDSFLNHVQENRFFDKKESSLNSSLLMRVHRKVFFYQWWWTFELLSNWLQPSAFLVETNLD